MIIDSHAHYNHSSFKNSFRYLTRVMPSSCSDCRFRRKYDDL